MAARVAVSIAIGGSLAATRIVPLVDPVVDAGLSTQWDGPAFDAGLLPRANTLRLFAPDMARGWARGAKPCASRPRCSGAVIPTKVARLSGQVRTRDPGLHRHGRSPVVRCGSRRRARNLAHDRRQARQRRGDPGAFRRSRCRGLAPGRFAAKNCPRDRARTLMARARSRGRHPCCGRSRMTNRSP